MGNKQLKQKGIWLMGFVLLTFSLAKLITFAIFTPEIGSLLDFLIEPRFVSPVLQIISD